MKTNDQATPSGCPDLETISAVFDDELVPDGDVRAHLDSCTECTGRLADYAAIRGALARALATEPDPGMNSRIAAFVRAKSAGFAPAAPSERDFSNSRTAWILRIAALFLLGVFFVYLLTDQMHTNRSNGRRADIASVGTVPARPSVKPLPALSAEPGTGDYVRARLVSNSPSERQYAINIDPALVPDELDDIPEHERIPVPFFFGSDDGAMRRIPLQLDPAFDAMRMLESIRRDLTALDVPGLSIETESRGTSLFTTIRLDSAGMFDMSMARTDDAFELFLMSGGEPLDNGPVVFHIEFFCE